MSNAGSFCKYGYSGSSGKIPGRKADRNFVKKANRTGFVTKKCNRFIVPVIVEAADKL